MILPWTTMFKLSRWPPEWYQRWLNVSKIGQWRQEGMANGGGGLLFVACVVVLVVAFVSRIMPYCDWCIACIVLMLDWWACRLSYRIGSCRQPKSNKMLSQIMPQFSNNRVQIDRREKRMRWVWRKQQRYSRTIITISIKLTLTLEILQDAIRWWHHHFHHSPYYIQYHHTAVIITGKWVTTTTRHIHCSASLATIIRSMAVSSSNDVLSSSCHIITGKTQFGIIGIAPKNASLSQFLIFGIQCHRPWNDWSELIGFQSCT